MKHTYRIATAEHAASLARQLTRAVDGGKVLSVTVERYVKRRSVDQNARMWAILNQIAANAPPHMDGVWYDPQIWHEAMKRRFLGVEDGPFGPVAKTTTKLNTVDFSAYCDQIEAWAAGEGIYLGAHSEVA